MKKSIIIPLMMVLFFCEYSFSQIKEDKNRDTVYIMIPKANKNFTMLLSKDSTRVSFGVIKNQYRTQKQRKQFYNMLKKSGMQKTSFYYSFYGFKKPIKIKSIKDLDLYSIDKISKFNINMSHKTKIFFIEKISCNYFLMYETQMQFEE